MENICSLDDGTESESERVNRESGRLADMGHCRSPNYFVRCGACVCVYVCACVPVYLCVRVCIVLVRKRRTHTYSLHTLNRLRERQMLKPQQQTFSLKTPTQHT